MRIFWGPNNIPELTAYGREQRLSFWKEAYGQVFWSRLGIAAFLVYAVCVVVALAVTDGLKISNFAGILVGNIVGSLLGQGLLVEYTRRRIPQVLEANEGHKM